MVGAVVAPVLAQRVVASPVVVVVGQVAVTPETLWTAWRPDLGVLVALIGLVVLYAHGVHRLWRRGDGRVGISTLRVAMFAGGVVALGLALVSPLDTLATSLFSAHMVQHLTLIVVAAPLLVASRLPVALLPLWPVRWRRWWGRRVTGVLRRRAPLGLVAAVVMHVAVVIAWHVPVVYDAAVLNDPLHALEHLTMLATAMVFWVAVGASRPVPVAAAGLATFVVVLSFTLLSATMTIAASPWYASHVATTAAWGLTPLEDQQLAAAIMWVPGGLVYLGAAATAVIRWIRDDEQRQQARLEHSTGRVGP